jgi:hypothetical protein
MSEKNDVVMIQLDKPRQLRFGHKALKMMLASMNIDPENFEVNGGNLEEVEKIMYFGLQTDFKNNGENFTLSDMEDLLDEAPSYSEIISKLSEAVQKAFNQAQEDQKNLQSIAQAKRKKA